MNGDFEMVNEDEKHLYAPEAFFFGGLPNQVPLRKVAERELEFPSELEESRIS